MSVFFIVKCNFLSVLRFRFAFNEKFNFQCHSSLSLKILYQGTFDGVGQNVM